MTIVKGNIQQRRFYVEAPAEINTAIANLLTVEIPGIKHTRLVKSGKWDGTKKFFDWRYKSLAIGLIPYVEKTLGYKFEAEQSDLEYPTLEYVPLVLRKGDNEYEYLEHQTRSLKLLLANQGGIAAIATNGGKTGVIAGIIASARKAGLNVLVLESMEDLLKQVKKEINNWLPLENQIPVSKFTADNKDTTGKVTVAMVPSLSRTLKKEMEEGGSKTIDFIRNMDVIIIDECHHATAQSYKDIISYYNKKAMVFGLSGTIPPVTEFKGLEIREVLGEVVTLVTNDEMIKAGISAKPLILLEEYSLDLDFEENLKAYKKTIRDKCFVTRTVGHDERGKEIKVTEFSTAIHTAFVKDYVMDHAIRYNNEFKDILKILTIRHREQSTLILCDWIELAEDLAPLLNATPFHSEVKDSEKVLKDFEAGTIKHVVATSKIDEGLSINRIEVIILATIGKSVRQFLQRLGRGLRSKPGENKLLVYDFMRWGHPYLEIPSKERLELWKAQGFEIRFDEEITSCFQK